MTCFRSDLIVSDDSARVVHRYLAQEPQLDATKTVFENVMDGLSLQTGLLKKFEDISAQVTFRDQFADL